MDSGNGHVIRLLVRGPSGGERLHELSAGAVIAIGRAEANDVRLDEPASSRRHCIIERVAAGGFELRDLGSKNGTLVNGQRADRWRLEPGDEVRIGATTIVYEPRALSEREPLGVLEDDDSATGPSTPPPHVAKAETGAIETVILDPREILAAGHEREEMAKLRKLLEINKAINSELNVRRLLERILDTAIAITGAERGFLLLVERERGEGGGPAGESLKVRASRNVDKETIKRAEGKLSRSVLRDVLVNRRPILLDDAGRDSRFGTAESVQGMQLAAILAVPLVARDRVLGVIYLDNRFRKSSFNEAHLGLLEIVGEQAAIAVENARLYEENLEKAAALEKAAQELESLNRALKDKVERQAAELSEARTLLEERRREYRFKHNYESLVTQSPKMLEIFGVLDRVTDSTVSVLIQGESGTGKELVARALHFNGPRAKKPFVSQNCAAIPATLMESEFFGHARGAFTGAEREKPGLFEIADGGTIFLDEIGDMSPDMQTKMLRVLQGGELRRVGSKEFKKVDVRVISATNRDLQQLIKEGKFREDLYYRLNVINVHLPPLRERKEDIQLLVTTFVKRFEERPGGGPRELPEETMRLLVAYRWPGNVRELENEIERACTLSPGTVLPEHLSPRVLAGSPREDAAEAFEGLPSLDLKELVARKVEEVERRAIAEALRRTGWKKSQAADLLGVSRPTLDAKIDKLGLKRE